MPIHVASPIEAKRLAPPLRGLLRVALQTERCRPGEIAIVLSDDVRLRELNLGYRGIPRTTDVLSFEYGDGDEAGLPPVRNPRARRPVAPKVHGDLVISLDRVIVQAKRFRVSRGKELARLVVHGALHLSGLDHHRAAERRHMRAREDQALREAGTFVRALERVTDRSVFVSEWRKAQQGTP